MKRLRLEAKADEQAGKIRQSFLDAFASLVFILEAKSAYTSGHSQRVSRIAVGIANRLGMPQHNVEQIRMAGLLHDIGKVGVSETILTKQDQLTKEEFMHIASHSTVGEQILRPVVDDREILKMVRHHHEHYDGTGYPDGLKARNIPIGARILAVADAYDAMTSARPYRKAMTVLLTSLEVKRHAKTQFDPAVVNAFIGTLQTVSKPTPPKQAVVIYS
ncbi:HD-GYP domain-containing protein [Chloroflexota bacterium]